MHLTTYGFVLFLHIALVIAGLSMAAVLHVGLLLCRASDSVAGIRAWPRVIARLEFSLPVIALLILGTGGWLIHLSGGEFAWNQGWVIASLIGLVGVEAAGASVGSRSAALQAAINDAPDGPVIPELRRRILDPALWAVLNGGTSVFLAIVFLMVVKPSGAWSAAIVVAVAVISSLSARLFTRERAATVPSPRPVVDLTERVETWTHQRS